MNNAKYLSTNKSFYRWEIKFFCKNLLLAIIKTLEIILNYVQNSLKFNLWTTN